jgi:Fe-S cluster assembly scaffold protein SufB
VVDALSRHSAQPSLTNAVHRDRARPRCIVDHFSVAAARRWRLSARHRDRRTAGSEPVSVAVDSRWAASWCDADISTALAAAGSECQLDGLYMARDTQHVDYHTTIDHQQPQCSSRELYKGRCSTGAPTGVFNGKVFVRPNRAQSDARQMNKNLLLSENAVINHQATARDLSPTM